MSPPTQTETAYYPSPIGLIELRVAAGSLTSLAFVSHALAPAGQPRGVAKDCRRQLDEYFAGKRRSFDLPLETAGTPFQRRVWEALRAIPHGGTASYADIARAVGAPRACRAVGRANSVNPIAIVVPCHRVVNSGGGLGGYSCGLERKRWLLRFEGARD